MYLTFLKPLKARQMTFEEILANPFMALKEIPYDERKRVTVEATDDYCESLFKRTGVKPEVFNTPMTVENTSEHYTHYEIPKKKKPWEKRPIDAPDPTLKSIQGHWKTYIEDVLHFIPHKAAYAYTKGRSVVNFAQKHADNKSNWYLQLDLKNFFNSIDGDFLKTMLLQVYPFGCIPEEQLDEIIKMSLLDGVLPQGSRLSPTLTNALMVPIDFKITETLHNYKHHHYVYTRYADDITISCKEKFDSKEIIRVVKNIFKEFNVPFFINNDKTRFGSRAGRNYHVGLIVNKDNKVSVGHEKNKRFRAMLFNFCTVGDEWDLHSIQKMLGLISYYKSVEPAFIEKTIDKYNKKFNIDILAKAKLLLNRGY